MKLSKIYTPLRDEVVIEFNKKDKTEKGILIPEQSQKEEKITKVVAIGKECKHVKIGDSILISPTARPKLIDLIKKDTHVQIWEGDVLGIVSKDFTLINIKAKGDA